MENIRFHQGDVIGASIDAIPASAIMVKNRPLAISDRTKHAHVLTGNVERYEVDKGSFIKSTRNRYFSTYHCYLWTMSLIGRR